MLIKLLLLIFILINISIAQENWYISYDPSDLSAGCVARKDSDASTLGSISLTSGEYTATVSVTPALNIEWQETATSVSEGDLPAEIQTNLVPDIDNDALPGAASYELIADHANYKVYKAIFNTSKPLYSFFGQGVGGSATTIGFRCDSITSGSTEFNCQFTKYSDSSTITQKMTFSFDIGVSKQSATVTIATDGNFNSVNDMRDSLLAAASFHISSLSNVGQDTSDIATSNEDRHSKNQGYVGVLWWFWVTLMVCQIVVTAYLQTWMWRAFPFVNDHHVFYAWIISLCIFLVIIMLWSGLFGWITIGSIYGVYSLIVLCIYGCVRYRENNTPTEGDIELQNNNDSNNVRAVDHDKIRSDNYTVIPDKLGKPQIRGLLITGAVYLVFAVFFFIIFFGAWSVDEYKLYDRFNGVDSEFAPQMVAKGSQSVYAFRRFASKLQLEGFLEWATEYCGRLYTEQLSDSEKEVRIKQAFIDKYNIDMSIFAKSSYLEFPTVNDWFIRELKSPITSVRPLANPSDNNVMVSPADARLVAFETVPPDQTVWIKGEHFNIPKLLGSSGSAVNVASMMIVRLAPQDYHRFHSPVSGTITAQYSISGNLHSVSADAMTSENDAIFNKRVVTVIDSTEFGDVYFVAIGAVCVGSIKMTKNNGDTVTKGDELGYFQFGGSTVALVIPHSGGNPVVQFDSDILSRSKVAVETYLHMGNQIGTKI